MKEHRPNRLISDSDDQEISVPIQTSVAGALPASPTRRPKSKGGNGTYPGRRQITAYVDETLFLRAKSISALNSKPMVEILEEALQAFVASYAARSKFQG